MVTIIKTEELWHRDKDVRNVRRLYDWKSHEWRTLICGGGEEERHLVRRFRRLVLSPFWWGEHEKEDAKMVVRSGVRQRLCREKLNFYRKENKVHHQYKKRSVRAVWEVIAVHFRRVRKNCEKRLLVSSCPSLRPSAYMQQLCPHRTEFDEFWCFELF